MAKRRKQLRLWFRHASVLSATSEREAPLRYARARLLLAIETTAPAVLSSLHHEPYDRYRALPDLTTRSDDLTWTDLERSKDGQFLALREALHAWAVPWNLDAEWVYDAALLTMGGWTAGAPHESWGSHKILLGQTVPPTVTFTLKNWKVKRETRRKFEARARKSFRILLAKHCARVEREFMSGKRARRHATHPARFIWTVRWVVCREPVSKIVKEHPSLQAGLAIRSAVHDVITTVQRTIDTVLAQADFQPKRPPLGRPRNGARTASPCR